MLMERKRTIVDGKQTREAGWSGNKFARVWR